MSPTGAAENSDTNKNRDMDVGSVTLNTMSVVRDKGAGSRATGVRNKAKSLESPGSMEN